MSENSLAAAFRITATPHFLEADLHGSTLRNTSAHGGFGAASLAGLAQGILARIDKRQFPRRVGLYLGDRTEALVYILAHELRHMHQQHGYAVHSTFPVGRVKNSRGRFSEVDTEAFAIHKLRAWAARNLQILRTVCYLNCCSIDAAPLNTQQLTQRDTTLCC